MLDKNAFANAAGVITAIAYAAAYLAKVAAPQFFSYWFDAQFFGANVSPLLPAHSPSQAFGILVTVFITSFVFGYLFAWLYNTFES